MSMSIDGSMGVGSMLQQMQNMQKHMQTLSQAAQAPEGNRYYAVAQEHLDNPFQVNDTPEAQEAQGQTAATQVSSFGQMLNEAFENMNTLQNQSSDMQTKFDVGDRSVTLADVMLATQKAKISFEAAVQIRNKMVEAYSTISQMQI